MPRIANLDDEFDVGIHDCSPVPCAESRAHKAARSYAALTTVRPEVRPFLKPQPGTQQAEHRFPLEILNLATQQKIGRTTRKPEGSAIYFGNIEKLRLARDQAQTENPPET